MANWHPIDKAELGMGTVLLRTGSGSFDPALVGYQGDDGRWFDAENREIRPVPMWYCAIPPFDADEVAQ